MYGNKNAYVFMDLGNCGRGGNSITCNPLTFTELEQILNDMKLNDVKSKYKTNNAPGACTASEE